MSGQTAALLSTHLRSVDPLSIVETVSRRSTLFNMFFDPASGFVSGNDEIKGKVNHTGNASAASFDEGDPEPTAGRQLWSTPTVPFRGVWVAVELSRKAIDVARGGASELGDAMQNEVNLALADLGDVIQTQLQSDGTGNSSKDIDGIAIAHAAAGTYAGLNRATETYWASHEITGIGALAMSDFETSNLTLRQPARMGRGTGPTEILAGSTVFDIAANLVQGENPGRTFINQTDIPQVLGLSAVGGAPRAIWIQGLPMVEIPGYIAQRYDMISRQFTTIKMLRNFTLDDFEVKGDQLVSKWTAWLNYFCSNSGAQSVGLGITS